VKHIDLADEQAQAADMLVEWARYRSGARGKAGAIGKVDDRVRALRGLAGTGKTVTAAEVACRLAALGTRVAVVAPTGKAAHVLRSKGVAATTIHAAAYQLIEDGASSPTFELRSGVRGDPDVVICDEASMATSDHVSDLLSRVPKVLLVGDPGQLPPVSGRAVLADALGVDLVTVHRQALDSGVVRFAHAIRRGASIADALREGAPDVIAGRPAYLPGVLLVGRNDLRMRLNVGVRAQVHAAMAGRPGSQPPWPIAGDRLVCLSNHRRARVEPGEEMRDDSGCIIEPPDPWCNGTVGDVVRVPRISPGRDASPDAARDFVALCDDGQEREGQAWLRQLTTAELLQVGQDAASRWRRETRFAWGWCLTTHKAQGSEWDEVAVMSDGFGKPDELRAWRYTAATRASKRLWWAA